MVLKVIEIESHEDSEISFKIQTDGIKKTPIVKLDLKQTLLLEEALGPYFETPFLDAYFQTINSEPLERIEANIDAYGLTLFETLIVDSGLLTLYRSALRKKNLEIRVIGNSIKFHSVYWETVIDNELQIPLVTLGVQVIRAGSLNNPKTKPLINRKSFRILVVTARPDEEKDINYRTIQRPIVEAFRTNPNVEIVILRPGSFDALIKLLEQYEPGYFDLIHLDLHGVMLVYSSYVGIFSKLGSRNNNIPVCTPFKEERPFICFESGIKNEFIPIDANELSKLLKNHEINICILNACNTAKSSKGYQESGFGQALSSLGIPYVLAMRHSLSAAAAKLFMDTFYRHLNLGKNLFEANAMAVQMLEKDKLRIFAFDQNISIKDWILPVQFSYEGFIFKSILPSANDEPRVIVQESRSLFFGRDLDILRLEKKFLLNKKVILLGLIGMGKTSLSKYLLNWWLETGFIEGGIYVDVSGIISFKEFLMRTEEALLLKYSDVYVKIESNNNQKSRIFQFLESRRLLVIIDHLENIYVDSNQNHTSPEVLDHIHDFLNVIKGSYVLVCSTFLSKEKIKNYSSQIIGPLDRVAIAELLGHYNHSSNIDYPVNSQNFHLNTLLQLAYGHPLTLKVLGPLLSSYSPEKVLHYFWGTEDLPIPKESLDSLLIFDRIWEEASTAFRQIWSSLTYIQLFFIHPNPEELENITIWLDILYKGLKDDKFSSKDIKELMNYSGKMGIFERSWADHSKILVNPGFSLFLRRKSMESAQDLQLRENFSSYYYLLTLINFRQQEFENPMQDQGIFREIHNFKFAALELLERGSSYWPVFSLISNYYQSQEDAEGEIAFANELIKNYSLQSPGIKKKLLLDQNNILTRLSNRLMISGKTNEARRVQAIIKSQNQNIAPHEDLLEKGLSTKVRQYDLFVNEAIALKRQGKTDLAIISYNKAITIVNQIKEEKGLTSQIEGADELLGQMLGLVYLNLSLLYRDSKGDLDKAFELGQLAIETIGESNRRPKEYLKSLLNMGMIRFKRKEFDHSIIVYEKAIHFAELQSRSVFGSEIGWSLLRLGNVYFENKNYYQAIQKLEKCLVCAYEIQDIELVGRAKESLGNCFNSLGEIDLGIKILLDAAQDYLRVNLLNHAGLVYFKLAKEFDKLGERSYTITMFERANSILLKAGNAFNQELINFAIEKKLIPKKLIPKEGLNLKDLLNQKREMDSHYMFAHISLPEKIHRDNNSLKLWEMLFSEKLEPLIEIWVSKPEELSNLEIVQISHSGLSLKRIILQTGQDSVLIKLPHPEISPCASYILIVLINQPISNPNPDFRYFTLELNPFAKFSLCEWNSEMRHINLNQEVENNPDSFIEACTHKILEE